jgi:hypothetical protein
MTSLKDLLVSRVRVKLLTIFFTNLDEIFYVRELVRKIGEEINAVRRELAHLEAVGLLGKEVRANRLYYGLKKNFVLYDELLRMVVKTSGFGAEIINQKNKIGKIKYVMLTGRFARNLPCKSENIDLLFVGEIVLPQVAAIVRQYEGMLKREINYTAMTEEEFQFRRNRRDPFILEILRNSKIMLIGDEEEMLG